MKRALLSLLVCVLSCACVSCGGGGGGGDSYVGAAVVSLQLEPSRIDPGDRTRVQIQVWEVHEQGILLKVRFPNELTYVANSSRLTVEGAEKKNPAGCSANG